MKEVNIYKIKFGSYLKLHAISGLGMGIVFAIIMLIVAILGGDVYANIGSIRFTGILAGINGLWMCPILSVIACFFFGIASYPGYLLIMKFKKSIKVNMIAEDNEKALD